MKNLLRLEFTKLKRQKSFYICLIIMLGLVFLNNLTAKAVLDTIPELLGGMYGSGISSLLTGVSDSSFTIVASIFVSLFVCQDYSQQTVKNIYARGYSRIGVYVSKLISTFVAATVMFVVVEAAAFGIGSIFFGVGDVENLRFLGILGAQYLVMMANIALAFALSAILRKNGGAIPIIIVAPIVVNIVLSLVDAFASFENIALADYYISSFLNSLMSINVANERIVECIIGSLIYIPVLLTAGLFINKKVESK